MPIQVVITASEDGRFNVQSQAPPLVVRQILHETFLFMLKQEILAEVAARRALDNGPESPREFPPKRVSGWKPDEPAGER